MLLPLITTTHYLCIKTTARAHLVCIAVVHHHRVPSPGPITGSHRRVPSPGPITGSHHRVTSPDPIIGSHHPIPSQGAMIGSHHRVPSQGPITGSHHRVPSQGPSQGPITGYHDRVPSPDLITMSHHRVPSQGPITGSHHRVPSQGPITQSHHRVPWSGPITGSHNYVPSQGPITQSHHRVPMWVICEMSIANKTLIVTHKNTTHILKEEGGGGVWRKVKSLCGFYLSNNDVCSRRIVWHAIWRSENYEGTSSEDAKELYFTCTHGNQTFFLIIILKSYILSFYMSCHVNAFCNSRCARTWKPLPKMCIAYYR